MPSKTPDGSSARRKRVDALRNRERILQVASRVFADVGVDAQMSDIAEAAEVGIATLYRNFPTKEDLVETLLIQHLTHLVEAARSAVEEPDPWEALVRFFQWVTTLQLENRVLSEFLSARVVGSSPELAAQRDVLAEILTEVCDRARSSGHLRPDVNAVDVFAALRAVAQVSSSDLHPRLIRRLAAIIVDGLQAPGQRTLEGPPVSDKEMDDHMALVVKRSQRQSTTERPFRRGRRTWPTSG